MQLRQKILLILAGVVGVYAMTDHVVQRFMVLGQFHDLERAKAQASTVRVKNALETELLTLAGRCSDWALGDGTSEFLEGTRPEFERERLADGVLGRENLDVLYLCDARGEVLWGRCVDPDTSRLVGAEELSALPEVGDILAEELRLGWRVEDRMRGLLRAQDGYLQTELGPLLVSTQLVPRSAGGGESGIVLLGRFVSERMTEELQQETGVTGLEVAFHDPLEAAEAETVFVESYAGEPLIEPRDEDWLQVYHLIETQVGIGLAPGSAPSPLLVRADVDRGISKSGQVAVNYALGSTVAAGLVLLWVLIGLLQKTVLGPISHLMNDAVRIGEDDTADVRFDLERSDEIGVLSREFDNMMEKLAASRAALVDTAREAGKSEIATGILHNVGNVLNSVNISASMVARQIDGLGLEDLERLVEVLRERGIKKHWMTQGRTDFIADNPELIADLASVGLMSVLSGFESNDDDALAALEKGNSVEKNRRAAQILADNGIQSTGIFMVRPDFDETDFDRLFDYINDLGIVVPIITIWTPLPGTQLEKKLAGETLTQDRRFYDLLHAVTKTKLPRAQFYENFTRQSYGTMPSVKKALSPRRLWKKRDFWMSVLPNVPRYVLETWRYRNVHHNPESYLRDEVGVLDGRAVTKFSPKAPVEKQAAGGARLPVLE